MSAAKMYVLTIIFGYILGSISFARLVFAWKMPGEEIEKIRTISTDGEAEVVAHSIGATSVMMVFGRKWGMAITVLDVAKGFLPVFILHSYYPGNSYHLVGGLAVLIGHLWPLWYKFKGGGGYSSIMGMLLALSPLGLVATQIGGALLGKWNQRLLFLSGIVLIIPWFMIRDGVFSPEAAFAIAIAFCFVLAQLPEIIKVKHLMSQGYEFDRRQVVDMMKHASKDGIQKDGIQREVDK